MKIVVCVKPVVDSNMPININAIGTDIEQGRLGFIINPADVCVLEQAVCIKESVGKGDVTVITAGTPLAEKNLRDCLALGADWAIHLCNEAFAHSDPYTTATNLAKAIKGLTYDLILCGAQSLDWNNGQTGIILAELLNLPQVTAAVAIEVTPDEKSVTVYRKLERGDREILNCRLPALLTIEREVKRGRYPKLRYTLAASRKDILRRDVGSLRMNSAEVGRSGSLTEFSLTLPKPRLKKLFAPPSNLPPEERLALAIGGPKKDGELLHQADAHQLASQVIKYLKAQKIISN